MRNRYCDRLAGLLAITLAGAALPASAQDAAKPVVLTSKALRSDIYMVEGGTANSGIIVGDKGVILIDAQRTEAEARSALALVAKITPRPVTTVIVTHGDPDHAGGLPAYPKSVVAIAQENTRAILLASAADAANGGPFFGPIYTTINQGFVPSQTVADREDRVIDGVAMQLIHVAPAHSSGDLFIYLPKQKLIFAGDIVLTDKGRFPIIHVGGSSLGWIESMRAILALKADIIVPGHGPVVKATQLRAMLADAEKRRADIKGMIMEGKSWPEIAAALPEKAETPVFPTYTWTTYQELTRGYPEAVAPWINMKVRREQDAASK